MLFMRRTTRTRSPLRCWGLPRRASSTTCNDMSKPARPRLTDATAWQPVFAATLARETHESDLDGGAVSAVQVNFSYWDGFGREIQKKLQADPGPVTDGGPVVSPRWVGSGWTIFNNKGKPVRKYEPFFSSLAARGHQFEFGAQVGVSPILCYDPVDRVVATVHPNQTYEKVVFDPWHQQSWDVERHRTEADPTTDPDVGDFFRASSCRRLHADLVSSSDPAALSACGAERRDQGCRAREHAGHGLLRRARPNDIDRDR